MRGRWLVTFVCLLLPAAAGCRGSKTALVAAGSSDASADASQPDTGVIGSSDAGTLGGRGDDSGSTNDADSSVLHATCGSMDCGLHGDCVVNPTSGLPGCTCDVGYVATHTTGAASVCVEDKTCVNARILDCRQTVAGSSEIGVHFSLSYCSGNPYTSLNLSDLVVEEKGLADFQQLLPSESFATIVPQTPVAHIYLVIDVSNSILQSKVLPDVAKGAQALLDQLKQAGGEYWVSVLLFDGKPYLYEFIKDTNDLAAARAQLDNLNKQQLSKDSSSSNVYGAVIEGIHKLDRAQAMRKLVNNLGVLTTGTLIVISDGDDRASAHPYSDVDTAVKASSSSVITVGLGDVANYPQLTMIGRDGSFSAPQPTLITQAFQQIAQRIKDYHRSLYFVGYCSPKRGGALQTRIGVKGFTFAEPVCTFNSSAFAAGCSANSFVKAKACAGASCGGIMACGECGPGSCCTGATCGAPQQRPTGSSCGAEWMCGSNESCVAGLCADSVAEGMACNSTSVCDLGNTYCGGTSSMTCTLAAAERQTCTVKEECQSLHCSLDPDNPAATSPICLPQAQMYGPCSNNSAACEPGSYCDGTTCLPMKLAGVCTTGAECMSGDCGKLASGAMLCGPLNACMFSLNL